MFCRGEKDEWQEPHPAFTFRVEMKSFLFIYDWFLDPLKLNVRSFKPPDELIANISGVTGR